MSVIKAYLKYFFSELYRRIGRHHLTAFSAQMAYFFVLSVFPFMIFLFAILSRLEVTYAFMASTTFDFIPNAARDILQDYVKNNLASNSDSVLSVSILAALWSASKALNALQRALNSAYEVHGRKSPFIAIGLSLGFTLGLSLSVVVMLLLPSMGEAFIDKIRTYISISPVFITIFTYFRWTAVIIVPLLILSLLYRYLPNLKLTFREVIPGTCFAYVGWIVISFAFSFFIQNFSNISIVYGSLAAIVVLMIWFYFTGMILMLGGEMNSITKAYKRLIAKDMQDVSF